MLRRGRQVLGPTPPNILLSVEGGPSKECPLPSDDLDEELFMSLREHAWTFAEVQSPTSGTKLTKFPPLLSAMKHLKVLRIIHHELHVLHEGFCLIATLEVLDLSENIIARVSPKIGGLQRLQVLRLHGNQIPALPASVGNLTALTELRLGSNKVMNLPDLSSLALLKKLDLSDNKISVLTVPDSDQCLLPPHVEDLDLSHNRIKKLPDSIAALTHVTHLSVRGNPIIDIAPLAPLKTLVDLNACDTNVTELPAIVCEQLSKLVTLNLQGTEIAALPAEFYYLSELRNFKCANIEFSRDHGVHVSGSLQAFCDFTRQTMHALFGRALLQLIQPADFNGIDLVRGGAVPLILDLVQHPDPQLRRIGLEVLSSMVKFEHSKADLLRGGVTSALLSVLHRSMDTQQSAHANLAIVNNPPMHMPSHSSSVASGPEQEAVRGNERRLAAAAFDMLARNSTTMVRIALAEEGGIHELLALSSDEDAVVAALVSQALASLGTKLPLTGYLHVRAMEAANLCVDPRSPSAPAKPYVHFQVDEAEFSTECATDKTLPGWPESRFTCALFQPVGRTLAVSVYDHRKLYWDTHIGTALVPLSELMDCQLHDRWVVLQHPAVRSGSDSGRVARLHLSLQFVPHSSEELDQQAEKAHAWVSPYKTVPPCPPPYATGGATELPCIAAATYAADVVDAVTTPDERITYSLPALAQSLPEYSGRDFVDDTLLSLDCSNAVYYDEPDCLMYPHELINRQWSNRHAKQRYFLAERPEGERTPRTFYFAFLGHLDPAKLLAGLYHMASLHGKGRAHAGLLELANEVPLLPLVSILRAPGHPARIVLTGHSAGGAVALLVYLRLAIGGILTRSEVHRVRVITFGRPLCIDEALAAYIEEHGLGGNVHSYVNYGDLAASLLATSAGEVSSKYFDAAKDTAAETLDQMKGAADIDDSSPDDPNHVSVVDVDLSCTDDQSVKRRAASQAGKGKKKDDNDHDNDNDNDADEASDTDKAEHVKEQASNLISQALDSVDDSLTKAMHDVVKDVDLIDVDSLEVDKAKAKAKEAAKSAALAQLQTGRMAMITSVLDLMQTHLKDTAGQVDAGHLGSRGAARLHKMVMSMTAENTLQPLIDKFTSRLNGGELTRLCPTGRCHVISDSEAPVISSLRKSEVILDYLQATEPFSGDNFAAHSLSSYVERLQLLKGDEDDGGSATVITVDAKKHMEEKCGSTSLRELGIYKPARRMSIHLQPTTPEDGSAGDNGDTNPDDDKDDGNTAKASSSNKSKARDESGYPVAVDTTPKKMKKKSSSKDLRGGGAAQTTQSPGTPSTPLAAVVAVSGAAGTPGTPAVDKDGVPIPVNLEPFRPLIRTSTVRYDPNTFTLDISLVGSKLDYVSRIKFRGSTRIHPPIYQTDDEIRFRISMLPRTGSTLDYTVVRVTSHFGEARQRLNLSAYDGKMPMEPAVAEAAASVLESRAHILERNDPPAMVFTVSQGAFRNLLGAAFNVFNHRQIADVLLKTYLFSDYFQEQLAEAGDLEMVLSLVELEEVHVPSPVVVLNPRTKQVTVALSNVRLRTTLAFRLIRFTDYFVYRDCGAELVIKNLSGKFVFDVTGGMLRPATTIIPDPAATGAGAAGKEKGKAAAGSGPTSGKPNKAPASADRASSSGGGVGKSAGGDTPAPEEGEPACTFDIDIGTLDLKLGLDIERGGIQYANKANWGYTGVIISRMSKRLKQLLVWLLSGRDFTQFLSTELMAAMVRDKPDAFELDAERTFLVDYSLTRPPDIVRSDTTSFFQTAHRASVGLQGEKHAAVFDSLKPPEGLLKPELLQHTQDAHATVVIAPYFFNTALTSLYLAHAFDVTLRVNSLPAAIQALLTPKLLQQLALPAVMGMGIRVEVLEAPAIEFGDNLLRLKCRTACHVVGSSDTDNPVMTKEVPILAEMSMKDFTFSSEGLSNIGAMVMSEGGVSALKSSLGQYGEEISEFIKVLYQQVIVPMFTRLISMTSRARVPHLSGLAAGAKPKVTCTPEALFLSISVPTFEFSHQQLEKLSSYLISKINPHSSQTLHEDFVESGFGWAQSHTAAYLGGAEEDPTQQPPQ